MRRYVMPWKESSAACEQRVFIEMWLTGEETVSGLCRLFGISRVTGHKRINRYREYGFEGLGDRSSAPHTHPNATSAEVCRRLIEAKQANPTWGPKKLVASLRAEYPEVAWPAPSTAGEILDRAGLVKRRRRRRQVSAWSEPFTDAVHANDVWSVDFKGWIRTQDGARVDPLTVQDASSRYLLACRGLARTQDGAGARRDGQRVQRVRSAAGNPHGQRTAVWQRGTGRVDHTVYLVDQAGDNPGAHRAWAPRAEREAGTSSQDTEG